MNRLERRTRRLVEQRRRLVHRTHARDDRYAWFLRRRLLHIARTLERLDARLARQHARRELGPIASGTLPLVWTHGRARHGTPFAGRSQHGSFAFNYSVDQQQLRLVISHRYAQFIMADVCAPLEPDAFDRSLQNLAAGAAAGLMRRSGARRA